uniref:Secreted protein n=1 Tax=Salvator merianae TaxID=96440 RepID=A0A8D0BBG8_SALMN
MDFRRLCVVSAVGLWVEVTSCGTSPVSPLVLQMAAEEDATRYIFHPFESYHADGAWRALGRRSCRRQLPSSSGPCPAGERGRQGLYAKYVLRTYILSGTFR